MQPDATLHHGAFARVLQRTDALHYRGFVCHRRTNPEAEWHFTRSCSSAQALRGLHLSSLQHVTICMVYTCALSFFLFLSTLPRMWFNAGVKPLNAFNYFCLLYIGWLSDSNRDTLPAPPIPPFPRSDGGTEIRAEAASVCLCEGTI